MTTLHQRVEEQATPIGECGAVQSAPMSEKLLRLERLFAVLDARQIPKDKRARYLVEQCGRGGVSYWSGLLAGDRPFGEKVARNLEDKLGLLRGTLEEHGLAPDTAEIAAAFDALPVSTPEQLGMRKRIYAAIMGMLAAHSPDEPNTPRP
jgi:hypothetical protein